MVFPSKIGTEWCALAAYACTNSNGQPWTAARFPIGYPSYLWYWFHAARVFVGTFYALFSGINAAAFPVLIRLFAHLSSGSRRITEGVWLLIDRMLCASRCIKCMFSLVSKLIRLSGMSSASQPSARPTISISAAIPYRRYNSFSYRYFVAVYSYGFDDHGLFHYRGLIINKPALSASTRTAISSGIWPFMAWLKRRFFFICI